MEYQINNTYLDPLVEKAMRAKAFKDSRRKHMDSESKRERWHGQDPEHIREREARKRYLDQKFSETDYVTDEVVIGDNYFGEESYSNIEYAKSSTVIDFLEDSPSRITLGEIMKFKIPSNFNSKTIVFLEAPESDIEEWEQVYESEVNRINVPMSLLIQQNYRDTIFGETTENPVYHNSHQDEHYASRLDRVELD